MSVDGLAALVRGGFGVPPPARIGVAVSGGGDSSALLHLMADWRDAGGPEVWAVSVDHGLRDGSGAEAAAVGRAAAARGVGHEVLAWSRPARGNLEAAARAGRQALIADWARARGIADVALGHTADDQAETVLMRLARGSGVDGLAGMAGMRADAGLRWWRPLLTARRADVRGWLIARGIGWVEDPMNDDPAFDRVKARRALAVLAPLGVTVEGLIATAGWMALARGALEVACLRAEGEVWRVEAGDVVFAAAPFFGLPQEVRLRLLTAALRWVASAPYRPRLSEVEAVQVALAGRCRRTLAGCIVARVGDVIRVSREPAAVAGQVAAQGAVWDGRWRITGPEVAGARVAMLGAAGLARCPGWRATGVPRASLIAAPALWHDAALIAAPLAGFGAGYDVQMTRTFPATFMAH